MIDVVTSWGPRGYDLYGRRFLKSFTRFWPADVRLAVYYEGAGNAPEGVRGVDLLATEPCRSFLARHANDPTIAGGKPYPGKFWKPKALKARYNFRFDAYKFARKVFAIAHAARHASGRLFWIDGDVVTHAPVGANLFDTLLPADAAICHLPRAGYHSECGFVGFNLAIVNARWMIESFERVYANDEFFDFDEWHDSYIFDRMLERHVPVEWQHPIAHRDRSQPFDHSILGRFMTHNKGARKVVAA